MGLVRNYAVTRSIPGVEILALRRLSIVTNKFPSSIVLFRRSH